MIMKNTAKINQIDEDKQEVGVISSTGYRILLLLRALIERDLSIDELNDIFKDDPLAGNAVSVDTARICINTLRNGGCVLSRPSKSNNYRYHLISHPFTLTLNDDEFNTFLKLRDNLSSKTTWQDIIKVNNIYSKIIALTQNFEQIQIVNASALLFNIKNDVITILSDRHIIGKKVTLKYISPEFGSEMLEVVPQEVVYENRKLYLRCYVYKYNACSFLDIEKITEISDVGHIDKNRQKSNYEAIYRVFGDSMKGFEAKEYETVVEKNDEYIDVKATYSNEFCFVQRLLQFGADFKVIFPEYFKARMIAKLKAIKERYKEPY